MPSATAHDTPSITTTQSNTMLVTSHTYASANLAAGAYSFTAVATDNDGGATTSAAVNVTVNALPTVSITSPANGASFNAPASVPITVSASDTDGTINRVELYANAGLIATLTAAPYTFTWTNVPTGTYALSAKAFDNNNGQTSSAEVTVTVQQRAAALYFIHVDHLNTPRMIADASGTTVWKWDQQEPFGDSVPDENPSRQGQFEFPLRFPGQYADKETALFYNDMRDYDSSLGRYLESDPIGLTGGLNTYAYVLGNPTSYVDPTGESPVGPAAGATAAAARICLRIPACAALLVPLIKKAVEQCKTVRCRMFYDTKGHLFGGRLCHHWQITCWMQGVKGSDVTWRMPTLTCWEPGQPPIIGKPPSTLP